MKIFKRPAFTLVDLLLVIGLMAVVFSLNTVNLLNVQNKPSLDANVGKLFADLKSQQLKAMVGGSGGSLSSVEWGVYVTSNKYVLFSGSTYSALDAANFIVDMDSNSRLATTFASGVVVFAKRSGGVDNFSSSANTITVTNISSGNSKTITLNRLGVATIN